MKHLLLDTETTGLPRPSISPLDQQPHIIEIGLLLHCTEEGVLWEVSQLIKPPVEISEEITKITGITNDDVKDSPAFAEYYPALVEIAADADELIAHNAAFDVKMLKFELARLNIEDFPWPENTFCSMLEYTPAMGYRPKLVNLYEHFVGSKPHQTHRALEDVKLMYDALIAAGKIKCPALGVREGTLEEQLENEHAKELADDPSQSQD